MTKLIKIDTKNMELNKFNNLLHFVGGGWLFDNGIYITLYNDNINKFLNDKDLKIEIFEIFDNK